MRIFCSIDILQHGKDVYVHISHIVLCMLYQTTKLSLSHNKEPTLNKNVLETIPLSAIHIVGSI